MNTASDVWLPYEPSDAAPWNRKRVVHLHRRAGFAANWSEIERDLADGPHAAIDRLTERRAQLLLVSNELGQSLHAPTELGRKFVDLQGLVNQHIATRAENVAWMVAGIASYVKGAAPEGDVHGRE